MGSHVETRLPNAERAFVDPREILDYLLSLDHPVGRYKAAFLFDLGYSRARWARLRKDLLELAASTGALVSHRTPHGRKYVMAGTLVSPTGRGAEVVVVWIVRSGEDFPRLVTLVPGGSP